MAALYRAVVQKVKVLIRKLISCPLPPFFQYPRKVAFVMPSTAFSLFCLSLGDFILVALVLMMMMDPFFHDLI